MFLWRTIENYLSVIIKYPPYLFYCILLTFTALEFVWNDLHYHYVQMDHLDIPSRDELYTLMSEGIKLGTIRPMEVTVYGHQELREAFKVKAKNPEENVVIQVLQGLIYCRTFCM